GIDDSLYGQLAIYQYAGIYLRISMMMGAGLVNQSVADGSAGYPGLDGFGRMLDLRYQDSSGRKLHQYQYGYDLAGNRTFARVTQAPNLDGTPHDNDRSALYAYDQLNRLVDARRGRLLQDNSDLDPSGPTPE